MAIHKIVYSPHPALRRETEIITDFKDPALQTLIDDMFETMYAANGVGLAAPQIGISLKLAVIDVRESEEDSQKWVLINPEIISKENDVMLQEGCLSVPGVYDTVKRAMNVTMKAFDRHGNAYEISAEGLFAEAIQHEIDHLNGRLYIDLLSPLKRSRAQKKSEKFIRSN